MNAHKRVSFVVPAYNEEQLLGRCLSALHTAAKEVDVAYEVVVADDASTDDTARIAREHGARVVSVSHRQIAATRNAGARAATGECLFFVDADTVVNADALREALDALDGGAAGGGSVVRLDGRVPLYGRLLILAGAPFYRLVGLASGAFLFCTRTAFEAAGGFDEALFAAEEGALSLALKKHGRFVVLRSTVVTSGRKLRTHSPGDILGLLARMALRPRRTLRRREGMDVLYGERRRDPGV